MRVIVFAGLPGTGKTTLAEATGKQLSIPVFALDWLLGVMKPRGLLDNDNAAGIGNDFLSMLAQRQLMLNQSVILDSPAYDQAPRLRWQELAAQYDAQFYLIETLCSDEGVHRERIEGRIRGIPGWHELTWAVVERVRAKYEPIRQPHLTLDAMDALEANLVKVLAYVSQRED